MHEQRAGHRRNAKIKYTSTAVNQRQTAETVKVSNKVHTTYEMRALATSCETQRNQQQGAHTKCGETKAVQRYSGETLPGKGVKQYTKEQRDKTATRAKDSKRKARSKTRPTECKNNQRQTATATATQTDKGSTRTRSLK